MDIDRFMELSKYERDNGYKVIHCDFGWVLQHVGKTVRIFESIIDLNVYVVELIRMDKGE